MHSLFSNTIHTDSKARSVNFTLKVFILTLLKIIYGPNLSGVKSTLYEVLNF